MRILLATAAILIAGVPAPAQALEYRMAGTSASIDENGVVWNDGRFTPWSNGSYQLVIIAMQIKTEATFQMNRDPGYEGTECLNVSRTSYERQTLFWSTKENTATFCENKILLQGDSGSEYIDPINPANEQKVVQALREFVDFRNPRQR